MMGLRKTRSSWPKMLLYRTAYGRDWGLGGYQQQHACLLDGPLEGHAKLGHPKSEE